MSSIQLFDLNGEQRFTGTSVGGESPVLQSVSVPISSAALLALFTTPAQLVAAPGPGRGLVVVSNPLFVYHAGGTPYTDAAGGQELFVGWAGVTTIAVNNAWYANVDGFLDQAASQVQLSATDPPLATLAPLILASAAIADKPLVLFLDKFGGGGGNLTLGNGTASVVVQYANVAL